MKLLRRLRYLLHRRKMDAELAEEMEVHRAMLAEEGLSPAVIGNATLAREDSRGVWIWPWLESIWQDAAYAMRNLRRQPGFTTVVVLVLAAVIGPHTTLVTVIAGVVLRPWPGVPDGARVVTIYLIGPAARTGGSPAGGFPTADYRTL